MNIFEIIITLAISLGAVVGGVNIYHQRRSYRCESYFGLLRP